MHVSSDWRPVNKVKGATNLTDTYVIGYYRIMKNKKKGITMTNAQKRTEINKKIKSAKQVYIYNNWAEDYFKSTKEDLIKWFSYRYKKQAEGEHDQMYMDSFLKEMEDNLRIDEDNILYFN